MRYEKPALSIDQQIELLKGRKLVIKDNARAKKYLSNIGYFRLTGYMFHLQDASNNFLEGATFDEVIKLYQFDKKLRAILSEYLERIEVALRAKLTNKYSINHGFFWFTNLELYEDKDIYNSINLEIRDKFEKAQEQFLKSFKNKYPKESMPPSNMALEVLTLGKLCRLYKGLINKDEKLEIAKEFNLPSTILSEWFIYLTNIRNACAHHSRLWNRKFAADRPTIPSREKYKFNGDIPTDFNTTIYGVIALIDRLLASFNPENTFTKKIEELIEQCSVNPGFMGFPKNWNTNAVWKY